MSANPPRPTGELLSADEAAARLGVRKATLYAYASRGLLTPLADPTHPKRSRYMAEDVDRLKDAARANRHQASESVRTLYEGRPLVDTALTGWVGGQWVIRGEPLVPWSAHATLEQTAALLWQVPEAVAFGGPPPQLSALWHQTAAELRRADPQSRAMALWSLALPHLAGNVGLTGDALAVALGQHLRVAFACYLGQSPSALPLHEQMAQAWGLPASRHAALRQTLVLCADTLLNLSSLSSRMIASVQGSLAACLLAGMNYGFIRLSGGEFEAVEALFDAVLASGDPAAVAAAYRARGEVLPGFNHPMLVQGDPRAAALVALATSLGSPAQQWVAPMAQAHQLHPALDFGLVAVRRAVEGPRDAALTLVDAARCAGLLAHVLEQRQNVARMWVQARYVGPPPICRSD